MAQGERLTNFRILLLGEARNISVEKARPFFAHVAPSSLWERQEPNPLLPKGSRGVHVSGSLRESLPYFLHIQFNLIRALYDRDP
jgi:hypothetical protein